MSRILALGLVAALAAGGIAEAACPSGVVPFGCDAATANLASTDLLSGGQTSSGKTVKFTGLQTATGVLAMVPTLSGGGTVNFLRADGSWAIPPGTGGGSTSPGGTSGQVQFNSAGSFGGLSNTQLTADINVFSTSLSGAAPASGGGTTTFLRADGTWAAPAGTGGGTVNSVGMSVPAFLSVSGSPVTSSGTLAVSLVTETANTIFAGPASGASAAPTFRAIVPADLPVATTAAFGAIKPDGTTITISGGVISSAGGGSAPTLAALSIYANPTGSPAAGQSVTPGGGLAFNGATLVTNVPDATSTANYTVTAADMGGQRNLNGSGLTVTIPAISSTVFNQGQTLILANQNAAALAVSATPAINVCPATSLGRDGFMLITSNGTALDAPCFPGFGTITPNAIEKFSGSGGIATASSLTDDGTTVATSEHVTLSGLQTTGTIVNSLCQTSSGAIMSVSALNCFASGAGSTGMEISLFYKGAPVSNDFLATTFSRSTLIAASAAIKCAAITGATGVTTLTLSRVVSGSSTAVGTIVFAASGSSYEPCTSTFSSAVTFSPGDVLLVTFPSSADATLANVTISIPATQ